MKPLTENEFPLKDSFDAIRRIQGLPQDLFDKGYIFVSFDSLLDYFRNECNADRVKMAIVDKFWLNIAERNCL